MPAVQPDDDDDDVDIIGFAVNLDIWLLKS